MSSERRTPRFGDTVVNHMASDDNPTKVATFVRVVRRTGRVMNPGTWWECTDEHGRFWLNNPENCTVLKADAAVEHDEGGSGCCARGFCGPERPALYGDPPPPAGPQGENQP